MTAAARQRAGQGRLLRAEAGLTVVEALVAAFLLVLGALAVMAVLSAASRNTFRAEQSQVVVNRLQDELEQIKQLPFDQVALAAPPAQSADPGEPDSRVAGTTFDVGDDGQNLAPLVYSGSALEGGGTVAGGAVSTGPTAFENGDVRGEVHRYVVWLDDPECGQALCPGAQDLKRVIVAIRLDETAAGGDRPYQELHEDLADPDAQPEQNPGPTGGDPDPDYPWSFWLTDTTCDHASRQPITGDHATHNTLGSCGDGLRTGGTEGAPDLALPEAPPLDSSLPPDQQPLYDYADDVPSAGGLDKGVQLRRPTGALPNSCALNSLNLPPLEPDKGQKLHKWVTPPIPAGLNGVLLTGEGNLTLWTQTLDGAWHAGRICIYLFRRQLDLLGKPVDTPLTNLTPALAGAAHFEYEQDPWPRNGWRRLNIPLDFAIDVNGGPVPLLPDTRLGVAIGIDRGGTGGEQLQFMYDHPSFDSRLSVEANQVLPF